MDIFKFIVPQMALSMLWALRKYVFNEKWMYILGDVDAGLGDLPSHSWQIGESRARCSDSKVNDEFCLHCKI